MEASIFCLRACKAIFFPGLASVSVPSLIISAAGPNDDRRGAISRQRVMENAIVRAIDVENGEPTAPADAKPNESTTPNLSASCEDVSAPSLR
jgi:hypothetical protein